MNYILVKRMSETNRANATDVETKAVVKPAERSEGQANATDVETKEVVKSAKHNDGVVTDVERKKSVMQFFVELSKIKDANEYVNKWMSSDYFDFENVIEMIKIIERIPVNPESFRIGMLESMQRGALNIYSLVTLQTCQKLHYLIKLYNTAKRNPDSMEGHKKRNPDSVEGCKERNPDSMEELNEANLKQPIHIVELAAGSGVNGIILQRFLKKFYDVELTLVDNNLRKIQTTAEIVNADYYEKTNFTKPGYFNICFMCWLEMGSVPVIDPGYDLLFCVGERVNDGCTGWIESDENYTVYTDRSLSISSAAFTDFPAMNYDHIGIKTGVAKKHNMLNPKKKFKPDMVYEILEEFYESILTPEERKHRDEIDYENECRLEQEDLDRIAKLELLEDMRDYRPQPDDLYQ